MSDKVTSKLKPKPLKRIIRTQPEEIEEIPVAEPELSRNSPKILREYADHDGETDCLYSVRIADSGTQTNEDVELRKIKEELRKTQEELRNLKKAYTESKSDPYLLSKRKTTKTYDVYEGSGITGMYIPKSYGFKDDIKVIIL